MPKMDRIISGHPERKTTMASCSKVVSQVPYFGVMVENLFREDSLEASVFHNG